MDFKLSKEQQALKQEFEDFFRTEMKNAPPEYGRGGVEGVYATEQGFALHKYMAGKLGEKGWLSRPWPKAYGGVDASHMEQLLFSEVMGKYHAPGVDSFGIGMFAPTLLVGADEEQKRRLLPPLARGEVFYCQGWSEPDAGSDLANLKTTAIRDGDHYVVNGQKTWTTGAHRADHMFLLARTDPDSTRSRGLSVFNVKMDYPGIEVRPLKYMNNMHVYNDVYFKDVRIPAYDRIGPENEGWNLTRQTMNFERSGVGGFSAGRQTLEEIIEYVRTTKRDGRYLSENPVVRRKLAQLFIEAEVGQTLAYKITWEQQKGGLIFAASAASESKVFGTEFVQRMANWSTEIMGLYGQLEASKWAPMDGAMVETYQFSPAMCIYAGSNEIQRNLIAWVGLGLPRFK